MNELGVARRGSEVPLNGPCRGFPTEQVSERGKEASDEAWPIFGPTAARHSLGSERAS